MDLIELGVISACYAGIPKFFKTHPNLLWSVANFLGL